jgi:c-di-GMP-binding flagellar brake protein YcgR
VSQEELEALLNRVRNGQCSASLRADGTSRMLGQLQVRGLERGTAIHLAGVKRRDRLPPAGTPVTLSFLLDEDVVSIRTVLLEPLAAEAGGRQQLVVLRAAWPTLPLEWHRREEVRVATPELPPLRATLTVQGRRFSAELLNLTETGVGLGLRRAPPFPLQGEMQVDTLLPSGVPLHLVGEVRHSGRLDGDPLPIRLGLVLRLLPPEVREALRRMIQARRIIRSEAIREE